jgi:hypothetical protein
VPCGSRMSQANGNKHVRKIWERETLQGSGKRDARIIGHLYVWIRFDFLNNAGLAPADTSVEAKCIRLDFNYSPNATEKESIAELECQPRTNLLSSAVRDTDTLDIEVAQCTDGPFDLICANRTQVRSTE